MQLSVSLALSLPAWSVLNQIRIVCFLFSGNVQFLLLFFQFDPIAFHSSVVVACQGADQFLFSVPSDVADVTFEIFVWCDVDSHFISQVFGARFLLGCTLSFWIDNSEL